MEVFKHDKYSLTALWLVRQGRSFFITGKAGTGKTTLLKEIVKECRACGKNIAVSAPTGIAAMNAGGQTLHSLFGLKTITFIPGKTRSWFHGLSNNRKKVIRNLDVLIIDEISMVRCDLMDMVDLSLQHYKGNKKPFGGIQVILFGDLFQLPPVVTDKDEKLLYSHYEKGNPYFFSSDVIRTHPFPVLELVKVFRQQNKNFVEILNRIRKGINSKTDINSINTRLKNNYEPYHNKSGVFLRTRRRDVKRYNNQRLWRLSGKLETIWADIWADKEEFPKEYYPTDNPLKLKIGAKVMLLRNDNDGYNFANGTQGIITGIDEGKISVKPDDNDALITVERFTWKLYRYEWDEQKKSIIPEVCATFTQYPLKLAWAVTIHKSQGMTFNNAIIDAHNSFAAGQVYVALSRCRTLEGITLTSRITESDIMVNPKVDDYMKSVERIYPNNTDFGSENIHYSTGQYFETLSENYIKESKPFCLYEGSNYCKVIMTSKGFFLKIIDGGYFFLSELPDENILGSIWVQNKRGKLPDYFVSYSTDGMEEPWKFGYFMEDICQGILSYINLNTGQIFILNLKTGEVE